MITLKELAISYLIAAIAFVTLAIFNDESPLTLFWDMYDIAPIYPLTGVMIAVMVLVKPLPTK